MRPADSPPNDEPDHRRHWSTGAALDDGLHSVVNTTGSDESTAEQPIDPVDGRRIAGSTSVVPAGEVTTSGCVIRTNVSAIAGTGYPTRVPISPPQDHLGGSPSLAGYRPQIPEQGQCLHPTVRTGHRPMVNSHWRGGRRWQLILQIRSWVR